jgi:hypothetical protein
MDLLNIELKLKFLLLYFGVSKYEVASSEHPFCDFCSYQPSELKHVIKLFHSEHLYYEENVLAMVLPPNHLKRQDGNEINDELGFQVLYSA